jgi:hypothetical protein
MWFGILPSPRANLTTLSVSEANIKVSIVMAVCGNKINLEEKRVMDFQTAFQPATDQCPHSQEI